MSSTYAPRNEHNVVSNGCLDSHPCKGCYWATLDEERHMCDAAGYALERLPFPKPCKGFAALEKGQAHG